VTTDAYICRYGASDGGGFGVDRSARRGRLIHDLQFGWDLG
jgi:hypothetical protein